MGVGCSSSNHNFLPWARCDRCDPAISDSFLGEAFGILARTSSFNFDIFSIVVSTCVKCLFTKKREGDWVIFSRSPLEACSPLKDTLERSESTSIHLWHSLIHGQDTRLQLRRNLINCTGLVNVLSTISSFISSWCTSLIFIS